jgi:large subunit ribosomal protein L29
LKAKEARALSDEDLKKQLEAAHKELFELRFSAATKQLKNHRDIPKTRKKIALLKTVIRQRELEIRQV